MRTSFLPTRVRPISGAFVVKANRRESIIELATQLNDVPDERLPLVMSTIIGFGIMDPGLIRRAIIRFAMWRKGLKRTEAWLAWFDYMREASDEDALRRALHSIRLNIVDNMLNGNDREEITSVGGFSQREAQSVSNIIAVSRRFADATLADYEFAATNLTECFS